MLFGDITDGKMILTDIGIIVKDNWLKIPDLRSYIELDEFVIMPNHFHGIMIINENTNIVQATHSVASTLKANSIGSIIGQFKSATTKEIQQIHIPHFK
jgi:putative transposase